MDDEAIRQAFRVKVEQLNKPSFSPKTTTNVPNGIVHIPVPKASKNKNELKQKLAEFVKTKFGALVALMLVGLLLAFAQTNSATPFKYVLFRNLAVAYFVNWWMFRNKQ
jgi:hypothetical protein